MFANVVVLQCMLPLWVSLSACLSILSYYYAANKCTYGVFHDLVILCIVMVIHKVGIIYCML